MKHIAKYFQAHGDTWAYYHDKDVIQKQRQQTLPIGELCSNTCKDNSELPKIRFLQPL